MGKIPEINRNEGFQKKNIIIKEAQKENSIINKDIGLVDGNPFENEVLNNKTISTELFYY